MIEDTEAPNEGEAFMQLDAEAGFDAEAGHLVVANEPGAAAPEPGGAALNYMSMNEEAFIYFKTTSREQSANLLEGLKSIQRENEDTITSSADLYLQVHDKFSLLFKGTGEESPLTTHMQVCHATPALPDLPCYPRALSDLSSSP